MCLDNSNKIRTASPWAIFLACELVILSLFLRPNNQHREVTVEVLKAVLMRNEVFWNVTLCRTVVIRVSKGRFPPSSELSSTRSLLGLRNPEDGSSTTSETLVTL
jgi:hypothetical protein